MVRGGSVSVYNNLSTLLHAPRAISWSAFFIRLKALMPRFASSFISFLALNTYRSSVRKELPENMGELCWVDIFMMMIML